MNTEEARRQLFSRYGRAWRARSSAGAPDTRISHRSGWLHFSTSVMEALFVYFKFNKTGSFDANDNIYHFISVESEPLRSSWLTHSSRFQNHRYSAASRIYASSWVSSAYMRSFTEKVSIKSSTSSVHTVNSSGPTTEPCSTLQMSATAYEMPASVLKIRVQPER